jgi:mono/diheme cytochrome c family protein
MHASRNGPRGGVALASAIALFVSLGFAAAAIAIEPTPGIGVVAAGAPLLLAQNAPAKVSYSNEQAKRGQARFTATCVDCHGEDLRGGLNGGPPLRGGMFNMDFGGGPASALFYYMSTMMPPEAPGRFSDSEYIDLMAYVLQVNGFEAGTPLPAKPEALDNIVLAK